MDNRENFSGFSNGGLESNNPWNVPQGNKPVENNPAEVAPAEAPNPLVEQRVEGPAVFRAPENTTVPTNFEEHLTAVTEELPNMGEMSEKESVVAVEEGMKRKPTEVPNQSVTQDEGEFSYRRSVEEDLGELLKKYENEKADVRIKKMIELNRAILDKLEDEVEGMGISEEKSERVETAARAVAGDEAINEAMNGRMEEDMHSIKGDPSSAAERASADTHNTTYNHDRTFNTTANNMVLTDADRRPFGNN